jgi:HEAT repeat protein
MARVFISYVQEDLTHVVRLVTTLREYGIEVWFDRDQLRPGHRWRDEIRVGIAQGDFFIACFSKRYSERARTYMNEELTLAIEELRQRSTDRAWFLPVLLSDTQIPDRSIGGGDTLRSLQWVNLYSDWHTGVARILSVVQPNSGRVLQLIQSLNSESARERIRAADSLRAMGPLASQAVPRLLEILSDQNVTVRASAAQALGIIGVETEEVVAKLLSVVAAEEYYSSLYATMALANLGRLGVYALLDAVTSARGYALAHALDSLVGMGHRAVPHLIGVIESGEANSVIECRRTVAAEQALREISDPQALSILSRALQSSSVPVRSAAADAIGVVISRNNSLPASEMDAAVKSLVDVCKDQSIRPSAIRALGKAGAKAKEAAVSALNTALNDENESVREDVQAAIDYLTKP